MERETDLLAGLQEGDTRAMQAVMRRHNRTLFRAARAILRDDAEAEEAVQEAWLQAFRGIGGFRRESKLSTWLVRITANAALMRRRRNARFAGGDVETMAEATPEEATLRAERLRCLQAAIDALPDRYRQVFVLRALHELSVGETAAALRIGRATVRSRYFRARSLLRPLARPPAPG